MKRVVIIGGGISGLTTAYRLAQSGPGQEGELEIHVFEASGRLGGVIQTETQNGFLMERGPDSFISSKPWAVGLCRELGLDKDFVETNSDLRQSFILTKNRLIPVPRGFYLMAPTKVSEAIRTPLLSFTGKIRMACELLIPPKKKEEDESLATFVKRRFGKEVLERIAQPMIAGIYTADPEELSLEATFPHFLKMEREHGSVIRALAQKKDDATHQASGPRYSLFLTLKAGLHSLISSLIERMPGVIFHRSQTVVGLEKGSSWKILSGKGETFEADRVCLAIPASRAAKLVNGMSQSLSQDLKQIPYETVATVNFAFHRKDIRHPLNGLGYVVPSVERKKMVGCTFSSIKFPGRAPHSETVLLRAFLGGKASRQLLESDDEKIAETVCGEVRSQLGISAEPLSTIISRWPEAIPQYRIGHRQIVERIFTALKNFPGLYLTGNAYQGTGMPDCIRHASQTADQILAGINHPVGDVQGTSR